MAVVHIHKIGILVRIAFHRVPLVSERGHVRAKPNSIRTFHVGPAASRAALLRSVNSSSSPPLLLAFESRLRLSWLRPAISIFPSLSITGHINSKTLDRERERETEREGDLTRNGEQLEENGGEREVVREQRDGRPQGRRQPRLLGRRRNPGLRPLGQAISRPQARARGERAAIAGSDPYKFVDRTRPIGDPQQNGLIYGSKNRTEKPKE
ncbi:hypothetical protein NL676_027522 [Syzygium grande]|nr:hypothetical protein NL676_027522 [Syzygium grande]